MRILSIFLILLISTILNISVVPTMAKDNNKLEFFVASGAKDGEGTLEKPFSTLEQARDAIRKLKNDGAYPIGGVTVYVRGGEYFLANSFKLEQQDSGTDTAPIVYRAYENEQVHFIGGAEYSFSKFAPCTDMNVLSRVEEPVRNKLYQFSLKENGVADFGTMPIYGHGAFYLQQTKISGVDQLSPELFFDGKLMTLSRWPNDGYAIIDGVVDEGSKVRNWLNDGNANYVPPEQRENPPKGITIRAASQRLKKWETAKDMWLFGYWYFDWSDLTLKVQKVDSSKGEIKTATPSAYGVKSGQRFYAYNLLEEIDSPGEWYLDRETGILYIYPPESTVDSTVQISLMNGSLFNINKAENVIIKGFTLKVVRGSAIVVSDSKNVRIELCSISKTADIGVSINGGTNCGIVSSHVFDTGCGGIYITGGDYYTLAQAGNYAENNLVHNYDRIKQTYSAGISLSGVGLRASYNTIHDGVHLGIAFGGNDNLIEYNDIYDVLKEADDMGAIYTGRSFVKRGNIVRNNYIHDIESDAKSSWGVYGIYLDDLYCGTTIEGNVFSNISGIGVFINGGRDNIVRNNIFANLRGSLRLSSIGLASNVGVPGLAAHGYGTKTLTDGKPAVPYDKSPYDKYPHLANILQDDPLLPKYNIFENNISYKVEKVLVPGLYGGITIEDLLELSTIDEGLVTTSDPGFQNVVGSNFNLLDGSAVFSQFPDFKAPDFQRVGVYTKAIRASIENAIVVMVDSNLSIVNLKTKIIDDENYNIMPIMDGDKVLIPARFIAENIGAEVSYDESMQIISISLDNKVVNISLQSGTMSVNGEEFKMSVIPKIIEGRLMVPIRELPEAFGKKVFWDKSGVIIICDNESIFKQSTNEKLIEELSRRLSNK